MPMAEQVEPSIAALIGRIDLALSEDDEQVNQLQQEVSERTNEVAGLKQEVSLLRQEIAALKALEAERLEAVQEAELTLAQLHESQKELQHYYCLCQQQAELLSQAEDVQARSFALLLNANT